ncbi:hypothetical protein, partial [Rhodoferax sp. UBA5149]|uniref:hypothetical protein n=1 Tax=Rhodoferax sp. UBA5149 TaxID=1947379 RepID=UPI0025F10B5A
ILLSLMLKNRGQGLLGKNQVRCKQQSPARACFGFIVSTETKPECTQLGQRIGIRGVELADAGKQCMRLLQIADYDGLFSFQFFASGEYIFLGHKLKSLKQ